MVSIPCNHPDIEEFIELKSDLTAATKANLSIRVTDEFMQAVKVGGTYQLEFKLEDGKKIEKTVYARDIFEKFCRMNWDYAEPALLYWDRIENYNLLSEDENYHYAGVNPCM